MTVLVDPFDNDGAADLISELREAQPGRAGDILALSLQVVLGVTTSDYLEKDYAESAVAAAAIIGALRNDDRDVLERCRLNGVEFGSVNHLVLPALAALKRVIAEESELLELWTDESEEQSFVNSVESIASLLRAPA